MPLPRQVPLAVGPPTWLTAGMPAFVSPPGDVLAHSRGARGATMIEMLTAFALLTAYLSSFVDWQHRSGPSVREDFR